MKNIITNICLLVFAVVLLLACSSSNNNITTRPKAESFDFTPKDTSWKALSIREKIGQTMIIVAEHKGHKKRFGSIEQMFKKYPVGGIFVPPWRFQNHKPESELVSNIQNCVSKYEAASQLPLIITEDFERGVGATYKGYTDMPVEMALGAANKPELARQYGNATAKEASTLGVNWLLHPVTDLNINPLQNLVIERAISDDANKAYPLLKAQIEGINNQSLVTTIKHFPGDGTSMKNQHLITSSNNMTMPEWNATFGTLFQNLINDGAPCIMVGHIRLPAYQTNTVKGFLPPATLSSELMQDLLKDEMKFNGVIMSDALNMGGAGGYYPNKLETAIACFEAGVDLVLWPDFEYMDSIEARINRGVIPMERLNDAVERIWGVREKFNLLTKKEELYYELTESDKETIKRTAQQVAENAITLISDTKSELPLSPEKEKNILIMNISFENKSSNLEFTKDLLIQKGFNVDTILYNPNFFAYQHRIDYFDKYDKVIIAFENRYFSPIGSAMLKGNEAMALWTANMIPFEKTIAISYSNPYYVNYYMETAPIRINAYSLDNFTQKAVVDALVGDISFKGTSPVDLDNLIMQ